MTEETTVRPSGDLVVQQTGQSFPLTKSYVTIGRVQGNDVVLDDSDISRHHASLTWDGQHFVLEDLKSTNGTFVNGARIAVPQILSNDDSIGLGGLTLAFQSSVAAAGAQEAQATRVRNGAQASGDVPPSPPLPTPTHKKTSWWILGALGAFILLILVAVALAAVLLLRRSDIPAVVITSPSDGSQVSVGEEVTVSALANDSKGVVRAELWVDDSQYGVMASPSAEGQTDFPVEFQWVPETIGSHTLDVRAYNSTDRISEPAEVVVNAVMSVAFATAEPTVTPDLTPSSCNPDSAFVTDVTIPDFTEVAPSQRLDKIWRLRNTGDCTWDAGYQFAFLSGEQMSAASSQAVSNTPPGGTADIPVTMYAPSAPGSYTGRWRLKDAAGQSFGTYVTIKIVVVAPEVPTLMPPDTPMPPPDTPAPADTPVPTVPCVAAIDFRADDVGINVGDSTTLRWDVECVKEVYLDGAPVTGHGSHVVSPASTTTYTLHVVKNDNSGEDRQVTVTVHSMGGSISANITYHSYDASSGWITLEIVNAPGASTIECVATTIINTATHVNYYGPAHSDTPFRPNPTSNTLQPSLSPGTTKYLRYKLTGNPTGVHCRATITLYTGDGKTGDHSTGPLEFDLPAGPPSVNANITYHSYDSTSGWVTFRIENTGTAMLECAAGTIINRVTHVNYYGPAHSNSPFRPTPTTLPAGDPSLAPGATKYLRYKLTGSPTGVPCRAVITVYTGDGKTGAHIEKTVDFSLPGGAPPSVSADITYHSYDSTSGWVTFRIQNTGTAVLECAAATIINRVTHANYYGPAHSNSPFRPTPTTPSAGDPSLAPGATKYLRYKLTGSPTGVPCRATIRVYTGDGKTGSHAEETVDFNLPGGAPPTVSADITYHSYDSASGWVTFQVENTGTATLECVAATIINRVTHANYYGPAHSNSPFRPTPTTLPAGEPSLAPGATKYLRYKLSGSPTGVPCRATVRVFTGDGKTGAHVEETVDFNLPGGGPPLSIQANITYHSYDAGSGWVTFRIVNPPVGAPLECIEARINHRFTSASYYGPAYSDTPFRPNPTSSTLEPNLPSGTTKYLRYKLSGSPTGVPCRAGFTMYTADGKTGNSATQLVFFNLP